MKLLYVLALVLALNNVQAQQVFQGSITYTINAPQEKGDAELLIVYGPNKIKLKFKDKDDYDKTYLIVDLDSSKFYTVNGDAKTFESRKLAEINTQQTVTPKTIAGYTTTPVSLANSGLSSLGFSGSGTFFAAPDLYYPVPQKHASIPELIMIQNNHIVLGAELKMMIPAMGGSQIPDSITDKMKININATKVTPQNIDIAEFTIPNNFTLQSKSSFLMTDTAYNGEDSIAFATDSVMMADTMAIPPPPKKKLNTNSKPSNPKKTTPTKTEAIKPKKTTTKS